LKIKNYTILIILAGIIISFLILYVLNNQKKLDIINGIGIVGSIASLVGISIAYLQILSVKRISESTNRAIDTTLNELMKSFSISDLSKAIKLIQEIQSLIRAEKQESALLRMQDLKSILIQIKHIKILDGKYENEDYKTLNTNLNIDISNINMYLIKQKAGISFPKICENLESVTTFFAELENNLKYNRDERENN
jgi:hypothetical protein